MYGLPLLGIQANHLFQKRLATKGYYQCQHTPGFWKHIWHTIIFCLIVNNFGIKVTNIATIHHLKEALEEHYMVAGDWKGSLFCVLRHKTHMRLRHADTHMPVYIGKAPK